MSTELALVGNVARPDEKYNELSVKYQVLLQKHEGLEHLFRNISKDFKKLGKQHEELKASKKELAGSRNYLIQRTKELAESRDLWKNKSTSKEKKLAKASRKGKPSRHHYNLTTIELATALRLKGKLSYNSIPVVLDIFNRMLDLSFENIPCANTVQNWVSKMGYDRLYGENSPKLEGNVTAIIDESIKIGSLKLLLVLLTSSLKNKKKSLSFSDVEVAYLGFSNSWTGEKVTEVFKSSVTRKDIKIDYVLSDEDSKLKKAARLLDLPHVADISHAVATCLRKVYEKDADYQKFIKQVSAYQCKGVNQKLSYLLPPKQRGKARFMNQHNLIGWAKQLLTKYKELNSKEKEFFKDLVLHQPIIESVDCCLQLAQNVGLTLKEEGYSATRCFPKTGTKEDNQPTDLRYENFKQRLEEYLESYEKTLSQLSLIPEIQLLNPEDDFKRPAIPERQITLGYNVCSDIIESLFGKYKSITSNNSWVEASSMALELPLYASDPETLMNNIQETMEEVLLDDINDWKLQYRTDNQMIKRRDFFKKEKKKS